MVINLSISQYDGTHVIVEVRKKNWNVIKITAYKYVWLLKFITRYIYYMQYIFII